jgi:outer membrane protein assembly factor BamB
VSGPPSAADAIVVVWSIDGRIFGLSAADGSRKWVYQRTTPPLTVRRFAGGIVSRGGLFTGTPGGKLLAIDPANGNLGWEANVTTPKGATELERLADVTSLPVLDERQVCAAAYLGRVACFDAQRGTLTWSRDFGSLGGLALDNRYIYLTDDKGAVQALDKSTGASLWKQDKLGQRYPSGPVLVGDYLGVVDTEGYLHLLDRNDGSLVGRLATDGKAPVSQPVAAGDAAIWQSAGGNLISAGAK